MRERGLFESGAKWRDYGMCSFLFVPRLLLKGTPS